jgi:hypothetical protein
LSVTSQVIARLDESQARHPLARMLASGISPGNILPDSQYSIEALTVTRDESRAGGAFWR